MNREKIAMELVRIARELAGIEFIKSNGSRNRNAISLNDLKKLYRQRDDRPVGNAEGMDIDLSGLSSMSVSSIARLVYRDWGRGKIYFGAKPYLEAMSSMDSVNDSYGFDSGKSIVLYFLSNARGWKGPVAVAVKKELTKRVK